MSVIVKVSVYPASLHDASLDSLRSSLGLADLTRWRDYYIEFAEQLSSPQIRRLCDCLHDPLLETVAINSPLVPSTMVQVAHLQSIVDNENDSVVALCEVIGLSASAARVATSYQSADPALAERVAKSMVNPSIEELHTAEPDYARLSPIGGAAAPSRYDLRKCTNVELAQIGMAHGRNLDADKMRALLRIQAELDLPFVTDVLVEAADSRWSDHCMHTTWRGLGDLLGRLSAASAAVENPNVVSMFEDNAGVWRFYDGWSLALKAETHNGPSAVSAYFGQLTKIGGVLRDILGTGLGADPIGVFEYTATGFPEEAAPVPGRPSPHQVALETIRAVKEYGNTFGVPMMSSRMTFNRRYCAKPFALGGSIGLIPTSQASRGSPQVNDLLVLIGGLTGNDGIHGASSSSAGSEMDHAAVQIGSPLEQVKFRQAIIDLRDEGCLRALTDLGGAGLNSGVGEIGDPGGVWLNTALVPLKTSALPPWIILLSESQERMILAIPPEHWSTATETLMRHMVRHAVVGRFTGDGRYTVVHAPELSEEAVITADVASLPLSDASGFSVPYPLLKYEPPEISPPSLPVRGTSSPTIGSADAVRLRGLIASMLADPEVASQRWADSQYDTTVQGNTAYGPTSGPHHVPTSYWAGTPLPGSSAAVLLATAFDPWLFEVDPVLATRHTFLRVLNSLVLAGSSLEDICLCDNFYTPDRSQDGHASLVAMVDELCELIRIFRTPVISGKDSSAGSVVTPTGTISVPPAVFLSGVGKVPEVARLTPNEWQQRGNLLVRIGPSSPSLSGTLVARVQGLDLGSHLDSPSATSYAEYLAAVASCRDLLASARPIGIGGVACTLSLGVLASGLSVEVDDSVEVIDLVSEHRCGAVVEVAATAAQELPAELEPKVIGRLAESSTRVMFHGIEVLDLPAVESWSQSWSTRLA